MARIRPMSLRNQIAVLIIIMTLLSLAIIGYTAVKQQQHDLDEAMDLTVSAAAQIQSRQAVLLAGAEQLAATVAALPVVQQRDVKAVNALLGRLIKTSPDFSNLIILDRSGSLWASAIPVDHPLSYSERRYFKHAVETGEISSGEYSISKIAQVPVMSFAYPIMDGTGKISDILTIVFTLDRYNLFYKEFNTGPSSSIVFTDHKGTILYSSSEPHSVGRQDTAELFGRMSSGPDNSTFEADGPDGATRIYSYRKMRLKHETVPYMYIRTGLNKDSVLEKSRRDLLLGAGALLPAMLLLLGFVTYLCKRGLLNKIAALRDVTAKIARGDLNARVSDQISGCELGDLGTALNDMALKLQQASEALRNSEKNYRELVENANSIILKWDNTGRVIYFNEFAEKFFGFSGEEIIGRHLVGTIVPETESSGRDLTELIRNICSDPDSYINSENENVCKDGRRVWISWNNHALEDEGGKKSGILSVGQDISERKKIEKELRHSEQRFRSFVENVNDVVFALTPEGIFSYVSPNWTEAFGYDIDETIGYPFAPFVHPADVPVCVEFLKRAVETGQKQNGVEYRVRHKDGGWLWYKANGSIMRDSDSDEIILIGIGRDITGLKKAEETLRQSEEKFAAAFRASPDAITLSRLSDGAYLEVNAGFTAITGYSAEESLNRSSTDLGIWDNPQDRIDLLRELHRNGVVTGRVFRLRRKDGSIRTGQMSIRIIEINGQQCLLGITRDVTEQEYLQNELIKAQKLESISVLAGGIAHNFNNVLTGVIGYISYAKKHLNNPDKVVSILDSAEKSAYRAASIARQLLTFSQGGIPVRKPVSADTLVEESVSLFLSGSKVKGTITCSSSLTINVDSQQISQAFNNIVLNALHAMPDGGTLEVRADSICLTGSNRFALRPGDYVRIVFRDSGCGIAKDDLLKVYDPYFTTKDSGTGLGLSTTHSIISKHGGHIDITSEVGRGTTVTVMLPASSEQEEHSEASAQQSEIPAEGISVLVMDDEEIIRNFAKDMLNEMGYEVSVCCDGSEAVSAYRKRLEEGRTFSAVILDLSIPDGMGGREAAGIITALDPEACLIASSGYANDPVLVDHRNYRFRGSIAKPYSNDELARAITHAIQERAV